MVAGLPVESEFGKLDISWEGTEGLERKLYTTSTSWASLVKVRI